MSSHSTVLQQAITETEDRILRDETMLKRLHVLLQELMPLVDRIRTDLKDSTTRMPDVSKQLSSVSQATESATVEILNVIEAMTASMAGAQGALAHLKMNFDAQSAIVSKIDERMLSLPDEELRSHWLQLKNAGSNASYIEHLEHVLTQTNEQSMNIAMALQVQDITSQQIAGATHLIEQVEARLHTALQQFETPSAQRSDERISPIIKPQLTFDGSAEYTRDTTRQNQADEITKEFLGK